MKISELAKAAAVSKDTVRHYVDIGLLHADRDPINGYQVFGAKSLNRLQFIKAAKNLGLQLPDIQLIFADAENALSPCPRVRDLMVQRLEETRRRIAELSELYERMSRAVEQWQQMPNSTPNGNSVCQLIEQMDGGQESINDHCSRERNNSHERTTALSGEQS